jgi:hypothetical protein
MCAQYTVCILNVSVPKLATTTAGRQEITPLLLAVQKEKDLNVIQALIKGNGKKAISFETNCWYSTNTSLWHGKFCNRIKYLPLQYTQSSNDNWVNLYKTVILGYSTTAIKVK